MVLQEHTRRPGTMTLKWRQKKQGWSRSSTSIPMPVQVESCCSLCLTMQKWCNCTRSQGNHP